MPKINLGPYLPTYRMGWFFLLISFALYLVPELFHMPTDDSLFGFFVLNFLFTIVYFISLLIARYQAPKPRPSIPFANWVHFVLLFTISAFSLNRNMMLFADFPIWLNTYTLLGATLFLSFPYFNQMSRLWQGIIWLLAGAELILSIYFTLYLLPIMPLSAIGFFLFGLSLHSFVPVLWLVLIIVLMNQEKVRWVPFLSGLFIPIFVMSFYLVKWYNLQTKVKDIKAENMLHPRSELPEVIALAQQLPSDKLSEEILVSPHYSQRFWSEAWGLDFEGQNKYHNPLAVLGNAFFGSVDMDLNAVEAILNIRKDQRHKTEERLWSGISLSTSSITSRIQVYPQWHMAYHEKTFHIHNSPEKRNDGFWFIRETQQALYTFHLPEGSIVTSLSLWINGKEEKSRLSTRKKADSAFKQIVGVENRDPALVHWKEGNLVVVSVFPCTYDEDRIFKIGFTTPLKVQDNNLLLENIWFEGPDARHTREITEILVEGKDAPKINSPLFEAAEGGVYLRKGDYEPYWTLEIPKVNIDPTPFVYHGKAYSVQEETKVAHPTQITKVYFDLNQNWSKEEFEDLRANMKDKELYVMGPDMTRITDENAAKLFDRYQSLVFSLPYFHLLRDPQHSLVVSHSGHRSPLLKEMQNSSYADHLGAYFKNLEYPVLFVNIGNSLSPIYKTLAELRLITYVPMQRDALKNALMQQQFSYANENESNIHIPAAQILLSCKDTIAKDKCTAAPDHFMRLFAYNDIVRKVGRDFFNSAQYEDLLFREAEEAYVLSPVTSLIVLESEADYNRMNIKKNKDTLGNAEIMEGGSVPEPHEWALIAMVFILMLWFRLKDKPLALK